MKVKIKIILNLLFWGPFLTLAILSGCNSKTLTTSASSRIQSNIAIESKSPVSEIAHASSEGQTSSVVSSETSSAKEVITAKMFCGMAWDQITAKYGTKYKSSEGGSVRTLSSLPNYSFDFEGRSFDDPIEVIYSSVTGTKITDNIYVGMSLKELEQVVGKVEIDNSDEGGDGGGNGTTITDSPNHFIDLTFDQSKSKVIDGTYYYKSDEDINGTPIPSSTAPVVTTSSAPANFVIVDHTQMYTKMHLAQDSDPAFIKAGDTDRKRMASQRGRADAMNEYDLLVKESGIIAVTSKTRWKKYHSDEPDAYFYALLNHFGIKENEGLLDVDNPKYWFTNNESK